MVIKLLEIYKKELSSKKVFYKYLHWKKIVPYFVILFGLIVGSVSIAVWLDQPRLSLISYLSFPVLYVMRDILISERDRILREVHNCSSYQALRLRRLKKFFDDEKIDLSSDKLKLLITFVDKQAEESKVPFLLGRGLMAALLIPLWVQIISWFFNRIDDIKILGLFILILVYFVILISTLIKMCGTIYDHIINSDYYRLKRISNDLFELQLKDDQVDSTENYHNHSTQEISHTEA